MVVEGEETIESLERDVEVRSLFFSSSSSSKIGKQTDARASRSFFFYISEKKPIEISALSNKSDGREESYRARIDDALRKYEDVRRGFLDKKR